MRDRGDEDLTIFFKKEVEKKRRRREQAWLEKRGMLIRFGQQRKGQGLLFAFVYGQVQSSSDEKI